MNISKEVTKLERLTAKIGGRFKLAVLIQRRLKQLQRRELGTVAPNMKELTRVICDEIDEGKIDLVSEDEYRESLRGALGATSDEQKDK